MYVSSATFGLQSNAINTVFAWVRISRLSFSGVPSIGRCSINLVGGRG
ncbi:MAG: hypothetical protein ACUVQ8_07240 [Nitrososphaeria archaeon]